MGMLIRRHRDRHKTEDAPAESADGPTRKELREQAKALGLSTSGSKAELAERIAAHGKAEDDELEKEPPTEEDPGAGGDNPDAPAPEDEDAPAEPAEDAADPEATDSPEEPQEPSKEDHTGE